MANDDYRLDMKEKVRGNNSVFTFKKNAGGGLDISLHADTYDYKWDSSKTKFTANIGGKPVDLKGEKLNTALKQAFEAQQKKSIPDAATFDALERFANRYKQAIAHLPGADDATRFIKDTVLLRDEIKKLPALAQAAQATTASPQAIKDFRSTLNLISKKMAEGDLYSTDLTKFVPTDELTAFRKVFEEKAFNEAFGVNGHHTQRFGKINYEIFQESRKKVGQITKSLMDGTYPRDAVDAEKEFFKRLQRLYTKDVDFAQLQEMLPDGLVEHMHTKHSVIGADTLVGEFAKEIKAAPREFKKFQVELEGAHAAIKKAEKAIFKNDDAIKTARDNLAEIEGRVAEYVEKHPARAAVRDSLDSEIRQMFSKSSTIENAFKNAGSTIEKEAGSAAKSAEKWWTKSAKKLEDLASKEGSEIEKLGTFKKMHGGYQAAVVGGALAAVAWIGSKVLGSNDNSRDNSFAAREAAREQARMAAQGQGRSA